MTKFGTYAVAGCILLATALAGNAATFNIVASFSGGQLGEVDFDLTIDADFTSPIGATRSGLTVNRLTSTVVAGDPFPLADPVYFTYLSVDTLILHGGSSAAFSPRGTETDFVFYIYDFTTAPVVGFVFDTFADDPGAAAISPANKSLVVTEVASVPLPAGGILLFSGLGGIVGIRRRKKRAASFSKA